MRAKKLFGSSLFAVALVIVFTFTSAALAQSAGQPMPTREQVLPEMNNRTTLVPVQVPSSRQTVEEMVMAAMHQACLDVYGIPDNQSGECSLKPQP